MLTIYGIPNCDTVKKAQTWLKDNKISFEFINFKTVPPTAKLISHWLTGVSWEKLINKQSTTYKNLAPTQQKKLLKATEASIAIVVANSSLIKRPVVVHNDKIWVGFKEEIWKEKVF
jgi:arsenate reductase (glutaredoxin)